MITEAEWAAANTANPTVTNGARVTLQPPKKCGYRECIAPIDHLGPRAKYCDNKGACKQAAWRDRGGKAGGSPSGTYVAPAVTDTVDLGRGVWSVTFDDEQQVEVEAASAPHARTRARWRRATKLTRSAA